ncbi:MAG: hypothetical protein ABIN67_04170 [Ferruginibacter sp.]
MSNNKMRVYHRYLGFFLAGIMAVYAISGITMIFRNTDFLKKDKQVERQLKPDIKNEELGKELRMKDFKVEKEDGDIISFKQGVYNRSTGVVKYTSRELPYFLEKLTRLHKADTKNRLFFLNVFFGISLLFFVVSSFWMFMPKTSIFRKGLYFTLAGIVLTIILLII